MTHIVYTLRDEYVDLVRSVLRRSVDAKNPECDMTLVKDAPRNLDQFHHPIGRKREGHRIPRSVL